ncbi:MAG: MFS transporter, partial [Woeseiaceae bacterium]
ILAICGVIGGLVGMATTDPTQDLWTMALFAFMVAFSSATQDIAIDAYRIEAVDVELQGGMAGTYQAGYMLAVRIVGGAFALYIAEWLDWSTSYLVMAACMGVGFVTVLIIREPETATRGGADSEAAASRTRLVELPGKAVRWFIRAIVDPFVDFFVRNGWLGLVILVFIGLFRLSDITLGVMANPFYIDMGFSLTDIANATKVLGLVVTIAGAGFGGLLVYRIGVMPTLLIAAVLLMLTNLLFAWMAWLGSNEFWVIAVAVSADNFAFGISGSAFIAYLSSLTSVSYTATQYALFTSLMLLPGKLLAGFSGVILDATDYVIFFLYASSLGIPAILLVLVLMYLERTGHLARAQAAAGAGG